MLKRLWSGGYSLPIAFWVFNVCGTIAILVLTVLIVGFGFATHLWVPALTAAGILFWAYWIVSCVGVWRSATPYVRASGAKPVWGWLARGLILLWTARALWGLADGGLAALIATAQTPP